MALPYGGGNSTFDNASVRTGLGVGVPAKPKFPQAPPLPPGNLTTNFLPGTPPKARVYMTEYGMPADVAYQLMLDDLGLPNSISGYGYGGGGGGGGGSSYVDHFFDVNPLDQAAFDHKKAMDTAYLDIAQGDAELGQAKFEWQKAMDDRDFALAMGDFQLAQQKQEDANYWQGISAGLEQQRINLQNQGQQLDYSAAMAGIAQQAQDSNNRLQANLASATNEREAIAAENAWRQEQAAIARMSDYTERLLGQTRNQTAQFGAETERAVGMGNLALENNKFILEAATSPRNLPALFMMQRGVAPDWDTVLAGGTPAQGSALVPADVMGAYKPVTAPPSFSMNNPEAANVGQATGNYQMGSNPFIDMGINPASAGGGGAAAGGGGSPSFLPYNNQTFAPPQHDPINIYTDINPTGAQGGVPTANLRPGMNLATVGGGAGNEPTPGTSFHSPTYYDQGKTMQVQPGDVIQPGTKVWIDYQPAPKMATGGMTTAQQFMVGDAPTSDPAAGGARPEMIYNPTGAPISVMPNIQSLIDAFGPQVASQMPAVGSGAYQKYQPDLMQRFQGGTSPGIWQGGGQPMPQPWGPWQDTGMRPQPMPADPRRLGSTMIGDPRQIVDPRRFGGMDARLMDAFGSGDFNQINRIAGGMREPMVRNIQYANDMVNRNVDPGMAAAIMDARNRMPVGALDRAHRAPAGSTNSRATTAPRADLRGNPLVRTRGDVDPNAFNHSRWAQRKAAADAARGVGTSGPSMTDMSAEDRVRAIMQRRFGGAEQRAAAQPAPVASSMPAPTQPAFTPAMSAEDKMALDRRGAQPATPATPAQPAATTQPATPATPAVPAQRPQWNHPALTQNDGMKRFALGTGYERYALGTDTSGAYAAAGMGGFYVPTSSNPALQGQTNPQAIQRLMDMGMPISPAAAAAASGRIAPTLNMAPAATSKGFGGLFSLQTLARQSKGETEFTRGLYEGVGGMPWADLVDFVAKPTNFLNSAARAR